MVVHLNNLHYYFLHKEGGFVMFLAINMILVAIFCAFGLVRELKRKNFFAVGFAGISLAVFGWFGVMTVVSVLTGSHGM